MKLERALLCVECAEIHEAAGAQVCPSCGCSQSIPLARPLSRGTGAWPVASPSSAPVGCHLSREQGGRPGVSLLTRVA